MAGHAQLRRGACSDADGRLCLVNPDVAWQLLVHRALRNPLILFEGIGCCVALTFLWYLCAHHELSRAGVGGASFQKSYRTFMLVFRNQSRVRAGPFLVVSGIVVQVLSWTWFAFFVFVVYEISGRQPK